MQYHHQVSSNKCFHQRSFYCRKLTLADVDRVLCPNLLINQTVYDLDSLVLHDCTPDPAMADTPSASSDRMLGPSRSFSSGCLQLDPCDASTPKCSLSPSLSSPTILEAPRAIATKCSTRHISHLHFESRFESGNLRKAIQVILCKLCFPGMYALFICNHLSFCVLLCKSNLLLSWHYNAVLSY